MAIKDILRQHNIDGMQSEHNQQNQNSAEIRIQEDKDNPNCCLFPTGGEAEKSTVKERQKRIENFEISSYAEVVDPSNFKLPTVDPLAVIGRTFLMSRDVDGSVHCADVMCRVESIDGETEQYLLYLGD
eukprot:9098732-Ditylum_brightwellii.AAC.1